MSNRQWVDEDGFFIKGRYEGEDVVAVYESDPEYLTSILNKQLDRYERETIQGIVSEIDSLE